MVQSRVIQYEPFAGTIDPRSALPDGSYLQVSRIGNDQTCNESCWQLWRAINEAAQRLSAMPAAGTEEITRDLVESILLNIDRIFAYGSSLVVTRANRTFHDTYGGPAMFAFNPWPIRWPGENAEALSAILKFVSAAFQTVNISSNRLDNGILDQHLWVVLRPLFVLKATIMKRWFGIECQGDISPDELDAMFRGSNLRPPLLRSLDDTSDTRATLTSEDTAALEHESAAVPTQETIEKAMTGIDVWTFQPSQAHWATFAELLRRMEEAGPSQPPVAPFPFSTVIIGQPGAGATTGGSGAPTSGLTRTPNPTP